MLILTHDNDRFPDSDDAAVRYRLPDALGPAVSDDGIAEVSLATHTGGGLLSLCLRPLWPTLRHAERPVAIEAARFRLLLRAAGPAAAGEWHNSAIVNDAVVDRRITLSALEASLARRLMETGSEVLDVEVEYALRGHSPTYPWRIRADLVRLQAQLAALLGEGPASRGEIEAAFLGLTPEDFDWYPRQPNALPPPADAALALLAAHAIPYLFIASDTGWTQVESPATQWLDLDLSLPRPMTRWFGLSWSLSEFLAAQSDPQRYLFELTTPAPFEAAELLLTHDLTLSNDGIRKLDVNFRSEVLGGELDHVFLPGSTSAVRKRFVRRTFEELDLRATARATVMTSRGPVIIRKEFRTDSLSLRVDAQGLGIKPALVSAEPAVFGRLTALEVELGSRHIVLTQTSPKAWAIRRSPAVPAATTAVLETGERIPLGDVAPTDGNLLITEETLGVGKVVDLVFDWTGGAGDTAYLAVRTEQGPWRTLAPGPQRYAAMRLDDRLRPPEVRYQTRSVRRDGGGRTQPMDDSDWQVATGTTVKVPG